VRPKATFNERVSTAAYSTAATLTGPGGRRVGARATIKGRSVVITPDSRLRARTKYKVTIAPNVRDLGGNRLPSRARSWRFRTGR
jgi:hypothetical protein